MENKNIRAGLVIMASGLGKRFGGNKLMATLGERPLISWIIEKTEGLFYKRVVVTRNKDVEKLCENIGIDCIYHDKPNRNDTVRIGLGALKKDIEYCFFVPGDQPLLRRETLISLIDEAEKNREKIVRTSYGEIVGAPVGFPYKYFDELLNLPEGKGGNWVVKKYPDLTRQFQVKYEEELFDIDTVYDLEKAKQYILQRFNTY